MEGPDTKGDTSQSAPADRTAQGSGTQQIALANKAGPDTAGLNTQGSTTQRDATEHTVQGSGTQHSTTQQIVSGKGSDPEATADSLEAPNEDLSANTGPEKMSKCQCVPGVNDFWRSFMINNLNPEELDLRRPGEVADPAKPVTAAANLLVWRRSNMRVLNVLLVLSVIFKISGFAARISDTRSALYEWTPIRAHVDHASDRLCIEVCNSSTTIVDRAEASCRVMLSLQTVVDVATNQMSTSPVRDNITFSLNKTIEMCGASDTGTFTGYCESLKQLEALIADTSSVLPAAPQSVLDRVSSSLNEAAALLSLADPLCSGAAQINATCRALEARCSEGLSDGDQLLTCAASVVHGYVNQVSTVPIDAIRGNVSQILGRVAEGCSVISANVSGLDSCYAKCRKGVVRLRNTTADAVIAAIPGEVLKAVKNEDIDRADSFARYKYAQIFLSAYDLGIELLALVLAIQGSMSWLCYRDSRMKLMKACAVKLVFPFVISFFPVYSVFGIGDVASVHPELLIYRINLGLQIQEPLAGIFISTVPTIAYAAWVMLSLVPASSLWALFILVIPFLQLLIIWPASVLIVQFLGDWGCAIGFAMGILAYLFYCPPAYTILFRSDVHDDYAIFSKWYSRSLYARLLSYVVLGVFGVMLLLDLKSKYAPDRKGDPSQLVASLLTLDTFNSMLVAPNLIYYICIVAFVDVAVGLLAMMRKREGYLASDPTLTQLCQLLNNELTNVVTKVTTDTADGE